MVNEVLNFVVILYNRTNGVWLYGGSREYLHVCRGVVVGHHWDVLTVPGLTGAVHWEHLCAQARAQQTGESQARAQKIGESSLQ